MLQINDIIAIILLYMCGIVSSLSFFDFKAVDIKGRTRLFNEFKGKVLLVVNVASECGYTDHHYKGLVEIQKKFKHTNQFTVLGFPCNQFGAQEPKSESGILEFVRSKYKVNFPMFSKVNVKGSDVPDYWRFLTKHAGKTPDWNFWKYLVSHNGIVLGSWGPKDDVQSITNVIEAAMQIVNMHEDDVKIEEYTMNEGKVKDVPGKIKKHDEM